MTLYKNHKYSDELLQIVEGIECSELDNEFDQYILANRDPFEIPLSKYKGIKSIQLDKKNDGISKQEKMFVPVTGLTHGQRELSKIL